MLFKFSIDIVRCITNNPNIGIIPFDIGTPVSVIGKVAKSAIIIEIANSNGCICPISLFPINLITIKTTMYKNIALKKVISIKSSLLFEFLIVFSSLFIILYDFCIIFFLM